MPLLDLKTDLKSLKYGSDRPGGGDSGQPYQKVDINKVDSGFNRFRMTKFDDGLVRGGVVGAANASIVDTFRIGKFLKDFPKGPLFIVKQIGLQMSNPVLETKKLKTNNPTTGGGLLRNVGNFIINTANKIINAVGPTRIYNLGINTLAQVPVNAFGVHFNRHGILPVQDNQTKYLAVAQYNNEGDGSPNNRLVGLRSQFRLGDLQTDKKPGFNNRKQRKLLAQAINDVVFGGLVKKPKPIGFLDANKELTVNRYIGGPGSVYGIGTTTIPRKVFTEDSSKIDEAKNKNYSQQHIPGIKLKDTIDFGISLLTSSSLASSSFDLAKDNINDNTSFISNTSKQYKEKKKDNIITVNKDLGVSTRTSSSLASSSFDLPKPTSLTNNPTSYDGGKPEGSLIASNDLGLSKISGSSIPTEINTNQNAVPYSTPTLKKYEELRKKVNETSTTYTNYNSSNDTSRTVVQVNINRGASDFNYVSASLASKFNRTNDRNVDEDTMVIRVTPLDPFTGVPLKVLNYLGYITTYNENYDSTWGDVKYVGRAEKFYIFNEFKRSINLAFNVPCFNAEELRKKHCDVSELASILAGKYNNNLLGGIITKLRIGSYIVDQPGIITNLTFSPVDGSPWDIDAGFAQYLSVSFGFTVIHNYLPQYQDCGFLVDPPIPVPPEPKPAPAPPPPPPKPQPKIKQPINIPPTNIDSTNYRFPGRAGELQGQQPPTKFKNAFQEKMEQNYLKNTLKGG